MGKMRYEVRKYKNRQYPFRVYSTNGDFKAGFETLDDAIKDCDDRNEEFEYVVVYPTKPVDPEQTDWDALYTLLWKYAPEWAEWMAMDKNGDIYAYETKSEVDGGRFALGGRFQYIGIFAPQKDWQNSLRKRP